MPTVDLTKTPQADPTSKPPTTRRLAHWTAHQARTYAPYIPIPRRTVIIDIYDGSAEITTRLWTWLTANGWESLRDRGGPTALVLYAAGYWAVQQPNTYVLLAATTAWTIAALILAPTPSERARRDKIRALEAEQREREEQEKRKKRKAHREEKNWARYWGRPTPNRQDEDQEPEPEPEPEHSPAADQEHAAGEHEEHQEHPEHEEHQDPAPEVLVAYLGKVAVRNGALISLALSAMHGDDLCHGWTTADLTDAVRDAGITVRPKLKVRIDRRQVVRPGVHTDDLRAARAALSTTPGEAPTEPPVTDPGEAPDKAPLATPTGDPQQPPATTPLETPAKTT